MTNTSVHDSTPLRGCKTQPIQKPVSAAWDLQVSEMDLKKMRNGFAPESMEDKWLCYSTPADASGIFFVHLCRSWTKTEQIILKLQPAVAGANGTHEAGATITDITWEAQNAHLDLDQEEAKENAVMVCQGILGCTLENYKDD
ncbi:hypothetical protein G3M48_003046 [Beauveria asiatica]|uniref:Uncharacterized protein n=1 Tax=Beauveria asiatica TaxID=1069075 RepID=A0AAW0RXG3_9HYPO